VVGFGLRILEVLVLQVELYPSLGFCVGNYAANFASYLLVQVNGV